MSGTAVRGTNYTMSVVRFTIPANAASSTVVCGGDPAEHGEDRHHDTDLRHWLHLGSTKIGHG